VVIKPAEQTPLSLLELAKDFAAVGLPPGVVNVVTGLGPDAGAPIVAHPDVRKIAFTGSAEVGKLIMRSAADQLKRVSLELGGKSPNIFFSDADFEAAVDGALFGTFINQGEVCSAGSRVLVQKDIYKKFVDACAALVFRAPAPEGSPWCATCIQTSSIGPSPGGRDAVPTSRQD